MLGIPVARAAILGRRQAAAAGSSPLLTGLESYWPLTSDLSDAHGGRTLTNNNSVSISGGAANFTAASSQYLSRANDAGLQVADVDFTWSLWFEANSNANGWLVSKGGGSIDYEISSQRHDASDRLDVVFQFWNGAYKTVSKANIGIVDEGWHFVVCWHDATADTVNVQFDNGTAASVSTGGTAPPNTTDALNIGRRLATAGGYWGGKIKHVGFWKRTLTSSERTTLYGGGTPPAYPFS